MLCEYTRYIICLLISFIENIFILHIVVYKINSISISHIHNSHLIQSKHVYTVRTVTSENIKKNTIIIIVIDYCVIFMNILLGGMYTFKIMRIIEFLFF